MKQILLIVALSLPLVAGAQSNAEDVDVIQGVYGKEKKTIMADFLKLEDAQSDAFWALYDEYETKRKELGKRRLGLLDKYVDNFQTMDDATTSQLIKETADLGAKTDKLVLTYYKKMEKVAGVKPAAQFYELEMYFLSAIRLTIFERIPEIKHPK
jgi:Spy/CpxP family protein refolding chaperone